MRILHVETINRVAEGYVQGLDRRGHISTVVRPSLTGSNKPLPLKLASMPARIVDLQRVASQLTPRQQDIAHIHWASYGVIGLMGKVPYVVHCHGTDVRYRVQDPRFRPLLKPIFSHAAAVLCITPDILAPVRSLRPDALFVPAGIDTDQFAPAPETQGRPFTVLLFARLSKLKGAPLAVEALARFKARHPAVRVLLLDYGELSQPYQQQYGNQFEFIPQIAPDAVREAIIEADVVVGQFFLGALGLSELQAMSCAKPVIVNYRHPDAYPSPPPLCDAQTTEQIDDHLEYLYQHPDKAQSLGAQARTWVTRYHHSEVLAAQLEAIYKPYVH